MIEWIKKLYNNSVIRYIFFGGLTTLVNLVSYFIFTQYFSINYNIANVLSIILAILFAYFVNSRYVFFSKAETFKQRFGEFCKFVSARLSTMIIEVGGVFILTECLKINDGISKILTQFIVLVLNYVFSKLLVFK